MTNSTCLGPEDSETDVSIIIVNWNTKASLRDCLYSVYAETTAKLEIIVVDNASHDGSPEMVTNEYPDVTLIKNSDNHGFAAANNQGLRIATGRNMLLLNPDTIVKGHAIDQMLKWLESNSDVGCVGCQVWENETQIQATCFSDPGPLAVFLIEMGFHRLSQSFFGWPLYNDWDRKSARDVDVVSGMFMLLPRDVVEKIGLLDPIFFVYSEEADWCRRVRSAGYRCYFNPAARIVHVDGGSKSTEQVSSKMYVQKQKSKTLYLKKHYGLIGLMAAKLIFTTSSLLRLIFSVITKGNMRASARIKLSRDALLFHLTGKEPTA